MERGLADPTCAMPRSAGSEGLRGPLVQLRGRLLLHKREADMPMMPTAPSWSTQLQARAAAPCPSMAQQPLLPTLQDVEVLYQEGTLLPTMIHEMGHALGFTSEWLGSRVRV